MTNTLSKSFSVRRWTDTDCDILRSEHIVTITVEGLAGDVSIQDTEPYLVAAIGKMYPADAITIDEL